MPPAPISVTRRCALHQVDHLAELGVAADQFGNRRGQVRRRQATAASGRRGRGRVDLAGELVAAPGYGAHQVAVAGERLAQRRDLHLQVVLFDDPAGPDAAHQLVLAQDRAARVDQRDEHVEGAPAQLERDAVCEQFAALPQQPETAELDDRRRIGTLIHGQRL